MDPSTPLRKTQVAPEDFLSAADTIPAREAMTHCLHESWRSPATYLDWARGGLTAADDRGLDAAITYAKRAVGCRIDGLLLNHHLNAHLHRRNFQRKIESLQKIGIRIPNVVREFILDPRNELEHSYSAADDSAARHATEIAELFLTATADEANRESVVVLNSNFLWSEAINRGRRTVAFNGWHKGTMLFVDVFDGVHTAKLIDGEQGEVRYAKLSDFSLDQAERLARLLRSHFEQPVRSRTSKDLHFLTEFKRQSNL